MRDEHKPASREQLDTRLRSGSTVTGLIGLTRVRLRFV
jgi:hypothetical protein